MAVAIMRLVNRGALTSAMGQQFLVFSSAAKVQAVSFPSDFIPRQATLFTFSCQPRKRCYSARWFPPETRVIWVFFKKLFSGELLDLTDQKSCT